MKRLVVIGAVFGLTLGIGGGVAWAAAGNGPNPQHLTQQQMNGKASVAPLAAIDTSTEAKYTSIPPCRVVDTRKAGGALGSGHQRAFLIQGSVTLASQGGSTTGCGIPTGAAAASATITAVASAKGYLKAWAFGSTQPAASFMNFTNVFNAATGGNIPLGSGRIEVYDAGGPTQVVIDVTGYYMPPMSAIVDSSGTIVSSSRVTSVTKLTAFGAGTYQVDFDRNVSSCVYAANDYNYPTGVLVEPRSGDVNAVYVETVNASGTQADSRFYLTVTC